MKQNTTDKQIVEILHKKIILLYFSVLFLSIIIAPIIVMKSLLALSAGKGTERGRKKDKCFLN